ncbi:MAG: hypothetical protein KME46_13310 [Brasilonema angustatum HA4187-MV1]|nr:hypothetical protein [Brasilonema angustatum HA4187-MV1]
MYFRTPEGMKKLFFPSGICHLPGQLHDCRALPAVSTCLLDLFQVELADCCFSLAGNVKQNELLTLNRCK